jgi:hypothetical protein
MDKGLKIGGGFKKNHIPWNKGKKCPEITGANHPMFGRHHSEESKEKNRLKHLGKIGANKGLHIQTNTGRTHFKKGQTIGENNVNWKGGVTPIHNQIRSSIESKLWIHSVFARDGFTCQKTGQKGGKLTAHHILNFSSHPELRFAIDNGITLSVESHELFHKIYGRKNNTREQLEEFLNNK